MIQVLLFFLECIFIISDCYARETDFPLITEFLLNDKNCDYIPLTKINLFCVQEKYFNPRSGFESATGIFHIENQRYIVI